MDLTHHFSVPAGVDEAWTAFNNLDRLAPCFPGATITTIAGDDFEGSVKVKLGPIAMVYNGSGRFVERDSDARRVVIEARGKDRRGNGTATARVTASFSGNGGSTDVEVLTDLAVTGKPAQFGRGVISDVSDKLLDQFVSCVSGRFAEGLGTPVEVDEPVDSIGPLRPTPWVDDEEDNEQTIEMEAVRVDTEPEEVVEDGEVELPSAGDMPEPEPEDATPAADLNLLTTVGPVLFRRYAPAVGFLALAILIIIKIVNRRRR